MANRNNPNQLAPGVGDVTNRYHGNVYEVERAYPARNRDGVRAGQMQASEHLFRDPAISGGFVSGADARHGIFDVKVADQAVGRVEPGRSNPAPSWSAVDEAMKAGMLQGAADAAGYGGGFDFPVRPGANPRPLGPTFGLVGGERAMQSFAKTIAPEHGGRNRRSEAEVRD